MTSRQTDPNGVEGRNVLVVGVGHHHGGPGVVNYLLKRGASVRVTDLQPKSAFPESASLLEHLPGTFGQHKRRDVDWADIVVLNPAVPPGADICLWAEEADKTIESEMSLFFRECREYPCRIVGITGTKGKTSAAHLTSAILDRVGLPNRLAGNMGRSALDELTNLTPEHVAVLELSSFQIEGLTSHGLSPDVAALTNIAEDHLDRYSSFDAYADAKASMFHILGSSDWAILPASATKRWKTSAREITFGNGSARRGAGHLFIERDYLCADWKGRTHKIGRADELGLIGPHMQLNALVAIGVALALGAEISDLSKAVRNFEPVPGRLEAVGDVGSVSFVNDTAATAPFAAIAGLRSFQKGQVVAIVGGSDKGSSFEELARTLREYAAAVVLLDGSGTQRLQAALEEAEVQKVYGPYCSMPKAVDRAYKLAEPHGFTVLLSPGCASFGMFRDAKERGDRFVRAASKLAERLSVDTRRRSA